MNKLSLYQSFVYALKSKDIKRQNPVMISRFLNFIDSQGNSVEGKCDSFYEFTSSIDNRRMLECAKNSTSIKTCNL